MCPRIRREPRDGMDLQNVANLRCQAACAERSTLDASTMTSATSQLRHCCLVGAALAIALAFATPAALRAQSTAPAAAQKSEKMARPDTRIDTSAEKAAGAKSLAVKRQKLRDCGTKWQEEKKAKGLTGKAAYLKFLSTCMKG